jgi:hypothetical protein
MGTDQYTLRGESKVIDGIEIARYAHAYKHSWDRFPGARDRKVSLTERFADDAVYKHKSVRHFIIGDHFWDCETSETPVFELRAETERLRAGYADTGKYLSESARVIGYLVKSGRRYTIRPVEQKIAA